eukprot:m.75546 g.75546  ORF g.75546 m.75546 type:complete len:78 (-) comp12452_c2_seq4:239-472(-)
MYPRLNHASPSVHVGWLVHYKRIKTRAHTHTSTRMHLRVTQYHVDLRPKARTVLKDRRVNGEIEVVWCQAQKAIFIS